MQLFALPEKRVGPADIGTPDAVAIEAEDNALNSYVQGDKTITLWNCAKCGVAYALDTADRTAGPDGYKHADF